MIHQVVLVRGYILRKLKDTKIYISCLPTTETDALTALSNPQTVAQIVDYILEHLGHEVENRMDASDARGKTRKAVNAVMDVTR